MHFFIQPNYSDEDTLYEKLQKSFHFIAQKTENYILNVYFI